MNLTLLNRNGLTLPGVPIVSNAIPNLVVKHVINRLLSATPVGATELLMTVLTLVGLVLVIEIYIEDCMVTLVSILVLL